MNVWPLVITAVLYFGQAGFSAWSGNWPISLAFVCWAVANLALAVSLR